MNRNLLILAAASALALSACNKPAAESADTKTEMAVNTTQDATAAAVGATSAATLGSNTLGGYVSNAAQGDMYEIQAGQIAEKKAGSADVKAFAKMLVADHTKAMEAAKPLIVAAGETPPAALDERRKGLIDNLTAATAADFDKVYIDQQVAAHDEALTLHKGYADGGDNAGLKANAAKLVPIVQAHLDKAKALQAAAKK